MSLRKFIPAGLIALSAGLAAGAPSAQSEQLRALISWPPILQTTHAWPQFAKRVTAATKGSLTFVRSGPEVVPPFEQIEPVQRGLFHLLLTTGGYHAGTTPILSAFDAVKPDPAKIRSTGLFDWADKHYQTRGLKLLAILPTGAYQIMTIKKPGANGRLDGMKIRGTSIYHLLIRNLGASPVVLPARQIYPALQKGVVDGIAWPRYAVAMFKMHQAGLKYSMSPYFGQANAGLLINLKTFNGLTKEQQAALVAEGKALEQWAIGYYKKIVDDEMAFLKSKGVQYVSWGPTGGNIRKWFNEGVWANAAKVNAKATAEFKALVTSKGMMND